MIIDLRPEANNIVLCLNKMCINKCKRYYAYWKPAQSQSYIYPANKYDKNGKQKPCKDRLEEL